MPKKTNSSAPKYGSTAYNKMMHKKCKTSKPYDDGTDYHKVFYERMNGKSSRNVKVKSHLRKGRVVRSHWKVKPEGNKGRYGLFTGKNLRSSHPDKESAEGQRDTVKKLLMGQFKNRKK